MLKQCKVLLCQMTCPPRDVLLDLVADRADIETSDREQLQRLFGSPEGEKHDLTLWPKQAGSELPTTRLAVICRKWQGDGEDSANPFAPHIRVWQPWESFMSVVHWLISYRLKLSRVQGDFAVVGCVMDVGEFRYVSYDDLLPRLSVLRRLRSQSVLAALATFVARTQL